MSYFVRSLYEYVLQPYISRSEIAIELKFHLRNVDDYFGRYGAVDDNDDLVIWVDRVKKYATFAYYGEG